MSDQTTDELGALMQSFAPLYERLLLLRERRALLLAHYTSVNVIEQILKNNEIWLSNPLYMNDLEEMRLGVFLATELFPQFAQKAAGTDARANRLVAAFNHYVNHLQNQNAIDTYVFCLCRHELSKPDGLLSMWREYGSKGNGAALVFSAEKISFTPRSPLLIAEVVYANANERAQYLRDHLDAWVAITQPMNLPDDRLYLAAYSAFMFAKVIALTTKHHGFSEEHEFRVIYIPEHDSFGYLKPSLSYHVGVRGVEPKLRFKFGATLVPTTGTLTAEEITTGSLADLLECILLGPTVSSPLAKASFVRMLEQNNMPAFADRVLPSTIPLRPTLPV